MSAAEGGVILTGDCIEVMASMDADSVDAVVTDPPYGLEFMGKQWDKFADGAGAKARITNVKFKDLGPLPDFLGGGQATCANCGGDKYRATESAKRRKCRCDNPSFPNVGKIRGQSFQAWCTEWGREALRVTKPGGYLLAFGGTRTHHRPGLRAGGRGLDHPRRAGLDLRLPVG